MMRAAALLLVLFFAGDLIDRAAGVRLCGTPSPTEEEIHASNNYTSRVRSRFSYTRQSPAVINVYFNVIMSGSQGNIPQTQIDQQISVLNSAYAGAGIQFYLAKVNRVTNSAWWNIVEGTAETQMKNSLRYGTARDLNLYSSQLGGGLLGWATFPYASSGTDKKDGVVFQWTSLPGGSGAPYDLGATLTHEVGHWLGLYHTFEGGCSATGDSVADTPAEAQPAYGCPADTTDTCPAAGKDPIHNYMDYSDDACMYEFTAGQIARIQQQFNAYRNVAPAPIPGAITSGQQPLTTRGITSGALTTQRITSGLQPITSAAITSNGLTTSPLTTSPLTTSPLTTNPLTTNPLTTSQEVVVQPPGPGTDDTGTDDTGSGNGLCDAGQACPENSFCVSGACVCASGFNVQGLECVEMEDGITGSASPLESSRLLLGLVSLLLSHLYF
eukprot:TRINITY_DN588_c0_g1_i1.p1 TRINITY_DN588_c0_g1~~TRINITY_DN588_c0_g1_i1.p1  ORF type:complete len:441 (-),score=58.08 TRINITY_DN588_c0_g1_i1:34-1356(-)